MSTISASNGTIGLFIGPTEIAYTNLTYAHFDPNRFPTLVEALADTGILEREIIGLPYRCNR